MTEPEPLTPTRTLVIEPWRIVPKAQGRMLCFVVPGYTHIMCMDN